MNAAANLSVQDGDVGLQIVNLCKSYRKRPVIRDVSITLGRGEVVALLGPNGSGKTTCFYAIAGLVTPESGRVIIDGRAVTTLPMYRRAQLGIGYLPQEMSIFRGMSVEDNILSILEIAVPERHRRRERLEELLSEFSIEHLRRASALALSGGERRRVEIVAGGDAHLFHVDDRGHLRDLAEELGGLVPGALRVDFHRRLGVIVEALFAAWRPGGDVEAHQARLALERLHQVIDHRFHGPIK